ncbi:hypothetical protein N7528_001304 [Penicillium herquei]|nr:hypothetical protein N7528_001304 [Penicillium herquei]
MTSGEFEKQIRGSGVIEAPMSRPFGDPEFQLFRSGGGLLFWDIYIDFIIIIELLKAYFALDQMLQPCSERYWLNAQD